MEEQKAKDILQQCEECSQQIQFICINPSCKNSLEITCNGCKLKNHQEDYAIQLISFQKFLKLLDSQNKIDSKCQYLDIQEKFKNLIDDIANLSKKFQIILKEIQQNIEQNFEKFLQTKKQQDQEIKSFIEKTQTSQNQKSSEIMQDISRMTNHFEINSSNFTLIKKKNFVEALQKQQKDQGKEQIEDVITYLNQPQPYYFNLKIQQIKYQEFLEKYLVYCNLQEIFNQAQYILEFTRLDFADDFSKIDKLIFTQTGQPEQIKKCPGCQCCKPNEYCITCKDSLQPFQILRSLRYCNSCYKKL